MMLKSKFFHGLHSVQVKNAIRHKFEAGSYDQLLILARAAEDEFKTDKAIAKPQVVDITHDKWDQLVKEMKDIKERLTKWETAMKQTDQTQRKHKPTSTQSSDGPNLTTRKELKCFYCKKGGHLKRNCQKLLNRKRSVAEGDQQTNQP